MTSSTADWTDLIQLLMILMVPAGILLTVRYLNRRADRRATGHAPAPHFSGLR